MRRPRAIRTSIVLAGAILLGLISVPAWNAFLLQSGWGLPIRDGPPMAIVAHRGDLDHFPENTLEAIRSAAATDVDGIEFDVHQSASGDWWVIHDPMLDRTTDATGLIYLLSNAEIAAATIDGGIGFDAARHVQLRVPTLDDVLQSLSSFQGTIYVDLQHATTADASDLAARLAGQDAVILCRNTADVLAIQGATPLVHTMIRPSNRDSARDVDGWIVDAWRELNQQTDAESQVPYVVFVSETDDALEPHLLRRAWALGADAFFAKHLAGALASRNLLAGRPER